MFKKVLSRPACGKLQTVQVRQYAKKVSSPPTPQAKPAEQPQPQKQAETKQTPKAYPAPAVLQDRLFDINRRDLWKKREYDLTSENLEALKWYLSQSSALREKFLKEYPELKSVIGPDVSITTLTTDDVAREPIRVAVTGAAGSIGYALLARLASGDAFGPKRRIIFHLLELPGAMNALKGVEMELRDSAFPLVEDIICTDVTEKAFEGVDYALLVGAQPRKEGMERGDLLMKNAEIFSIQGKALNKVAKGKGTRVAVVGNPANTNAMIAQRNAPSIPPENFMAMTRLDQNRAIGQLCLKTNSNRFDVQRVTIWGNHSATQFPDISNATIRGVAAKELINDNDWVENNFIPTVQKRGAAIISARKASSAASAASALDDMLRNWDRGMVEGDWTSGAVYSNGEYGVDKGLFFSYPIHHDATQGGKWSIINGLTFDEAGAKRFETTLKELRAERDGVAKYL